MMKLAAVAALVGAASAFAPAQQTSRSSTSLSAFDGTGKAGALPPLGYWDPLGLCTSEELFDQYRAVELKHGRVSMLAVLGYVVPEFTRAHYDFIPGQINTDDIPNGVAALEAIPALGMLQIFFLVGAVDYYGYLGNFEVGKPELDPEVAIKRETQELNNGRLAMLAITELLRHDSQNYVSPGFDGLDNLITGLPFLYN